MTMTVTVRTRSFTSFAALSVAAFLAVTIGASGAARAVDPMADSFAGGGKKHKPAKKSPASPGPSSGGARHPASKPSRAPKSPKYPAKAWRYDDQGGGASNDADSSFAPPAEPASERPKPRRAEPADDDSDSAPRGRADRDQSDERDSRPSRPSRSSDDDDAASSRSRSRDQETRSDDAEDEAPKRRPPPQKRAAVTKKSGPGKAGKKAPSDEADFDSGVAEEEESDDEESGASALGTLASITPRAFRAGAGIALTGRSFSFADSPTLQHESSFPRTGLALDLEAFPLLLMSGGWWRLVGVGAFYAGEPFSSASVANPATGTSTSTAVKQSRWGIDLRAALPLAERLVIVPRFGLWSTSFTLDTKAPLPASECTSTMTTACLVDTELKTFAVGADIRLAASAGFALSVAGTYLVSAGVTNKPTNEVGYEIATSATGFAFGAQAAMSLTDWLALQAALPITRINYVFHPSPITPATVTYRSATETYWGFTLGVAIFTN